MAHASSSHVCLSPATTHTASQPSPYLPSDEDVKADSVELEQAPGLHT